MADWIPIDEGMPPERVVVDAVAPDGGHLRLKWQGRQWWYADGSHYLCFTPTYWRPMGADDVGRTVRTTGVAIQR